MDEGVKAERINLARLEKGDGPLAICVCICLSICHAIHLSIYFSLCFTHTHTCMYMHYRYTTHGAFLSPLPPPCPPSPLPFASSPAARETYPSTQLAALQTDLSCPFPASLEHFARAPLFSLATLRHRRRRDQVPLLCSFRSGPSNPPRRPHNKIIRTRPAPKSPENSRRRVKQNGTGTKAGDTRRVRGLCHVSTTINSNSMKTSGRHLE